MNTKTSFLFQISEYKWTVFLFYLVSLLIMGTSITLSDGSTVSGLEVATCFFLLVCGMNFQSALMFHLQMGSTRRTFFKGWLLSSCAVCLMTAALNLTVLLISQLIGIPMAPPSLPSPSLRSCCEWRSVCSISLPPSCCLSASATCFPSSSIV